MTDPTPEQLEGLWARHHGVWRDAAQVTSWWEDAAVVDPDLLLARASRGWWSLLDEIGITLLFTREYEHLLFAATVVDGRPRLSYLPVPHPSGLVVDRDTSTAYLASTRNPNQVIDLQPLQARLERLDATDPGATGSPLSPVRTRYLPGAMYMHDLALIAGKLHANAVGHNAVISLEADGSWERAWWPRCVEQEGAPQFGRNYIQLNSIAPGSTLEESYFSASGDRISARRPGHVNWPVDRRGVIFSGSTREVFARGLTRPHSARLVDGQVWVDDSGYGTVGVARDGRYEPQFSLPGWTRGLLVVDGIAFVGTSRVIPRFAQYAPGLDVDSSTCAIHAVELASGRTLASLQFPYGNQLFAMDWIDRRTSQGLPFVVGRRNRRAETALFYASTH